MKNLLDIFNSISYHKIIADRYIQLMDSYFNFTAKFLKGGHGMIIIIW